MSRLPALLMDISTGVVGELREKCAHVRSGFGQSLYVRVSCQEV